MKQQINFRASSLTARQLETLAARWGTTVTEAITVIVDRAYREEVLIDIDKLLSGEMSPAASATVGETWHVGNESAPYIELGRVPGQPAAHVLEAPDGTRRVVGGYFLRRPGEAWDDFLTVADAATDGGRNDPGA